MCHFPSPLSYKKNKKPPSPTAGLSGIKSVFN
uniref:Uncharacterized protein n=1 Tax=Siphoviridae sp. ct3o911 TaxID=2827560 RepID=A0A8S5LJW2_9CAUD|nr:MAG TPA: hypothetical protein [Siphoviridae sp. ct3o911]